MKNKVLTVTNGFARALRAVQDADLMVKLLKKYHATKRNTNAK